MITLFNGVGGEIGALTLQLATRGELLSVHAVMGYPNDSCLRSSETLGGVEWNTSEV